MTTRAQFTSVEDARRVARRRLPRFAFDFIDGGAEEEWTVGANRRAYAGVTFRPTYLTDVSQRDLTTTVCGQRLDLPIILAPTGLARLAGPEGDLAGARAAQRMGTVFTLACMSSHAIEEVAAAAENQRLWFQLYLWRDRAVVDAFVRRADEAGCQALVITVDVPLTAKRERDVRNGFSVPLRPTFASAIELLRHPRWLAQMRNPIGFRNMQTSTSWNPKGTASLARYINDNLANQAATWSDVEALRRTWKKPLLIKGILNADDARLAVEHGADAVIVSNHGGRQLDGAPPTLAVLPEIVEAVGDRVDVLVDGGVRRGSDVVKALALGAKACLVGRPWLYGVAAGGADGVSGVLETLRDELDRTLALVGRRSVSELDRTVLRLSEPPAKPLGNGRRAPVPARS